MEYHKIISVTGLSGLFELVGSKSDGAIVRSLEDKSTKFVSSRVHNFSHLESIEIFTEGDNVNLIEILQAMEKSDEILPDEKDAAAVKKYFEKVYPQMDFERVYASDTKKIVRWFKILKANNVELKLRETEESKQETTNNESEIKVESDTKQESSEKKISAKKVKEEKAESVEASRKNATKQKAEDEKTDDIPKDLKASKKLVKKSKEEPSEFVNVKQGEDKAPAKKPKKKSE